MTSHASLGKWSREGVPRRGWTCTGIEDLGSNGMITCEMCECAEIRYAHHLTHDDYPETLAVGCICAQHMEDDYAAPREREKRLRSEGGKKRQREDAWLRVARWHRAASGNLWATRKG